MSLILHIDTSTDKGIYFLSEEGSVIGRAETGNNDHAATILTVLDELLKRSDKSHADLSAIDVCAGPGSYTGLRIGLATAKGWCYAYGTPLIMTHKLNLMAETELQKHPGDNYYAAVLPARSEEFFLVIINNAGDNIADPKHVSIAELKQLLETYQPRMTGIGEATKESAEEGKYDPEVWALKSFKKFQNKDFTDIANAEPFYLKAPFVTTQKKLSIP